MTQTGDVNVSNKCMKCGKSPDNMLPMCYKCRIEMKDFPKLASFLNGFDGNRDDIVWLIRSEIADRQSLIISSSKIVYDIEGECLDIVPPDGHPFAKQKAGEIVKLYKALSILRRHYGA